MSDLISRQAAIEALKEAFNPSITNFVKAKIAIDNLPPAQPEKRTEEHTETHACDLISRQAAIDIEQNATVDTNPSHFEAHQKFTQFMDDAEISSFGMWQWSNGFNTALTAVSIDLKKLPSAQPVAKDINVPINDCISRQAAVDVIDKIFPADPMRNEYTQGITCGAALATEYIKQLPSARPEIVRCKDCENWDTTWQNDWAKDYHYCPLIDGTRNGDWYCADAERRTDE